MNTFTKYKNRKLYSRSAKGYVNLPDILNLVKDGQSVRVITHKTGHDVTTEVLREAIMRHVEVPMEQLVALARGE